jgi:hypothetical protein
MSESNVNFQAVANLLNGHADLVAAHVDPARREKVLNEKLADYAEGGRWQYAPADAKRTAREKVEAEIATEVGHALFHAHVAARDHGAAVERAIEHAQEPLKPDAAWLARTKTAGLTGPEILQLEILDELRQTRITRELETASPSHVLARYAAALDDPTEQGHATFIRLVEARFRQGWSGVAVSGSSDDPDVRAALALPQRIGQARASRIPGPALAARQAAARVRAVGQRAEQLHGFRAVRPS